MPFRYKSDLFRVSVRSFTLSLRRVAYRGDRGSSGWWINETRRLVLQAIIEPGGNHTCTSGTTGGWRCPVCGAVSPTAGAAQRHMDAHQGVKAFRCTICRYKGNTLRGMRTHIRMHFEKRGTDLQVKISILFLRSFIRFHQLSLYPRHSSVKYFVSHSCLLF